MDSSAFEILSFFLVVVVADYTHLVGGEPLGQINGIGIANSNFWCSALGFVSGLGLVETVHVGFAAHSH